MDGAVAAGIDRQLTERERTVLRYLPSLMTYEEIASDLYVWVNTVKSHAYGVFRKLGVSGRRQAVRSARELGSSELGRTAPSEWPRADRSSSGTGEDSGHRTPIVEVERRRVEHEERARVAADYEIRIKGRVGDSVLLMFEGLTATTEPVKTVLYGPIPDQEALHELLGRLQSLGLEVDRAPPPSRRGPRPDPRQRPLP